MAYNSGTGVLGSLVWAWTSLANWCAWMSNKLCGLRTISFQLLTSCRKHGFYFLRPNQQREARVMGDFFLKTYVGLHSKFTGFCPFKLFHWSPKLHLLAHMVLGLEASPRNPLVDAVWMDENLIGQVLRLARKTHCRTTHISVLYRYTAGSATISATNDFWLQFSLPGRSESCFTWSFQTCCPDLSLCIHVHLTIQHTRMSRITRISRMSRITRMSSHACHACIMHVTNERKRNRKAKRKRNVNFKKCMHACMHACMTSNTLKNMHACMIWKTLCFFSLGLSIPCGSDVFALCCWCFSAPEAEIVKGG